MEEFDFIVLGGGSGGCAVAGRLSEDPKTSVAVFEAGDDGKHWMVWTPLAGAIMVPGKIRNWAYDTVPQKGLGGRIGYQPRGKTLGGSSGINAMVYIRGHRADYDHWAALGNTGWSYADVLPYFKRSENNEELDGEYHGKDGPLRVSGLRSDNPVKEMFLQGAREAQFRIRDDFNGAEQEGLGIYQVTQHNGERWSAARGYIHPHMANRANLRVETLAHATRIIFEGKRAVGVEYVQGKNKEKKTIRAVMHAPLRITDPIITTAYIIRNHGYMIYDTLFAMDEQQKIQPQMVEKYETSADKLTWTFTSRDGLKWHDGAPVTSDDAIASLTRWLKNDAMG